MYMATLANPVFAPSAERVTMGAAKKAPKAIIAEST
ncbi:unannotated protein [freshwater metagenome]|uniref:Unannotated protein n=1 Tax=freshwater metagenome TaxID=449393 RepID=A0A6J7S591_9ZZZZ